MKTVVAIAFSSLVLVRGAVAHCQPVATTETPPAPEATPAPAAAPAPAPAPPALDVIAIQQLIDQRVDERLANEPPTAGWKDGFFIQTADGKTKIRIGGFTQFDSRTFVDDSANPQVDQFGFRSIRPLLEGTLADRIGWKLMPDFAGGKLVVQDAYTDLKLDDAAQIRAGKFKVPFGLERLQSEYATTFAERGLPSQLAPNRDLGVQLSGTIAGGVVEYELGLFNGVADGASGDGDVSDGKEGAARVFVTPIHGFGVGAAATFGQKNGTSASPDLPVFKTQGQTTIFQYDPMAIADGHQWRATGQADWYAGPIGVLAEYVRSTQQAVLNGVWSHSTADAWQVLGQWVVTGDDATFKSVAPVRPFDPGKGHWGAVDVAARAGQLRLGDNAFADGLADRKKSAQKATSFGVGADWFLTKSFRLALDLERTSFAGGFKGADGKATDRPDETSIVGRVQTVF